MIKSSEPLSMAEVTGYIERENEDKYNVLGFIKKFNKINFKDAVELKKQLNDLHLIKLRSDHIIKIIDLLPENQDELNKIFVDVSLDEDETKKILDTIKKFK